MQLKRILARDSRTATDQAIALYGADVLIISNHQVNGRTELVVALDLPSSDQESRDLPAMGMVAAPSASTAALPRANLGAAQPAANQAPGALKFMEALRLAERGGTQTGADQTAEDDALFTAAPSPQAQTTSHSASLAASQGQAKAQDARDYLRGREIVDLVRDELASLRREFRLTQQTSAWQQGLNLAGEVQALARAVGEAAMPQALRALLLDTLQEHNTPESALAAVKAQLQHTLARPEAALPTRGVHAIAGPSGSGKTLMTARLARLGEQAHGAGQVALISYHDVRAGAWSQLQMLAAQLGVDCFRAGDPATLTLLLNELAPRRLVLIDTPGVQMHERLAEVRAAHPAAACHAVVPADASSATLARLVGAGLDKSQASIAAVRWDSLLVSKLDECVQPWPLLHFLSNNPLALAGGSDGTGAGDLLSASPVARLVDSAVAQLEAACSEPTPEPRLAGLDAHPLQLAHTAHHMLNA